MALFTPKEIQTFDLTKAQRLAVEDELRGCLEAEMSAEVARLSGRMHSTHVLNLLPEQLVHALKRDMTVSGVSGSNYLVGHDNQPVHFLLDNFSVIGQAGARKLTGLIGNVTIPLNTTAGQHYWLPDETSAATPAQPVIGQLTLTPKNLVAVGKHSRQLHNQAINLDAFIARDIGQTLGVAVDDAVLSGSGMLGEPQGIHSTPGVASVSGTGFDNADAEQMLYEVFSGRPGLDESVRWVGAPDVRKLLANRAKFGTWGNPLWNGLEIAGFRAHATATAPTGTLTVGNFAEVVVGSWGSGAVELAYDPSTYFSSGVTQYRAWWSVDVGLLTQSAFAYSTNIT